MSQPARKYINLTPHPVVLWDMDGTDLVPVYTWDPGGTVARLSETVEETVVDGNVQTTVRLGSATCLPEEAPGTGYIVSMPLLMGLLAAGVDRQDLVYPYGQVRDEQGRIIGCRALARLTA